MNTSRVAVRPAELADTERALSVVRQSIFQLCVADHQNDPATLERWLANKTPEHFARWLADATSAVVVAELDGEVRGVGNVMRTGKVNLLYVAPGFERAGLGVALLRDLERRALAWGLTELSLESSLAACAFYVHHGYQALGEPSCAFGVLRCYPFKKALRKNP
jgi:GNAT superfamily N-acetyltransferase